MILRISKIQNKAISIHNPEQDPEHKREQEEEQRQEQEQEHERAFLLQHVTLPHWQAPQ